MADDITAKHLAKLRIRGAPAMVPGVGPMVGEYPCQQVMRSAFRVLSIAIEQPITWEKVQSAVASLRQARERQSLAVAGNPILALLDDPKQVVPHKRRVEAMLPIRGPSREEGEIKPARIDGGFYVSSRVPSFGNLEDAYTYLLGKFLPSRGWELAARKAILNILPEDLDTLPEAALIEICIPGTMMLDGEQVGPAT